MLSCVTVEARGVFSGGIEMFFVVCGFIVCLCVRVCVCTCIRVHAHVY